ncbi:LOW QUALITY PROTEIN: Helitron helicase-like protein [Phytophthora palmivora]|uniref:Helitron helicase-like protein n=1 Tax=Phytophthora palmivora TaxID=4796 RepID=A0A2P4YHC1_9STRA|nr:LOW QUALITY PROTEIN: Helitron helicase-like protein [Phytophthora palmivora]
MWLADYLISNGKTLATGLFCESPQWKLVSDGDGAKSIFEAELTGAYEPDDLERTATLADQMNENQKDIFDQVIEAVNHPVGGQKLFFCGRPGWNWQIVLAGADTCLCPSTEKGGDSSGFQWNRSNVVDRRTHGTFYISDPA